MLELTDVHTYYGESHILQGVSLKVEKENIMALVGRNGVGKTTTLHSVVGFCIPRKGRIFFEFFFNSLFDLYGRDLQQLDHLDLLRGKLLEQFLL